MLDKMKDLGNQAANKAGEAIDSITNAASSATGNLNEKAVRASTSQVCRILELAIDELKNRPLSERPLTLTASVNLGIAALEMQVHLEPEPGNSGQHLVLPPVNVDDGG